MEDPNATLPDVDPNEVIGGVHYARLYLEHVMWDRCNVEDVFRFDRLSIVTYRSEEERAVSQGQLATQA